MTTEGVQNGLPDGLRFEAVDALRGFALAGIVVAHMVEQYIAAPRPPAVWQIEPVASDGVIQLLMFLLVSGKFYSMFAVLFGMSFTIMMDKAQSKGQNFAGRFIWRLMVLLGFGIVHAAFYRGDILTGYVLIGLCLPLFYHLPNRWLLGIAGLLLVGVGQWCFYAFSGRVSLLPEAPAPDAPSVIAYVQTLRDGSFADVVAANLTTGMLHKFDFLFGVFGRGYMTLGYFLVGVWLVRTGFLRDLNRHRKTLKRVMWWSLALAVFFLAAMFGAFALMPDMITFSQWKHVFGFSFYNYFSIALTACLIAAFLRLFARRPEGRLKLLAPYGRMALTNYVVQSLLGTFLLFGWGLGYLGRLHDWQTLLIALVVIVFQVNLSRWWLSHFRYGPLEWLWRCGTYFRWMPFSRSPAAAAA